MMCGVTAAGVASDRVGRAAVLVPAAVATAAVGAFVPLASSIEMFIGLRFLHGFCKIGVFVLSFVWCMEVGGKGQISKDYCGT